MAVDEVTSCNDHRGTAHQSEQAARTKVRDNYYDIVKSTSPMPDAEAMKQAAAQATNANIVHCTYCNNYFVITK